MADIGRPLPAQQKPATNEYWGESLEDMYQYMEDPSNEEQIRWSKEQSDRAARFLSGLPSHGHFREQLERIVLFQTPTYFDVRLRCEEGKQVFIAQKRLPPNPQPLLVTFPAVDAEGGVEDRVIFNPTEAAGVPALDWIEPSPSGALVALSLSHGGTERGDAHILRTDTGHFVEGEVTRRVNSPTAGGSIAWVGEDGFYYTRHPLDGEAPAEDLDFCQKIYFHRMGTPSDADVFCLGETFPRIAECQLTAAPGGRHVLCACADGDGGEWAIYVSAGGPHPCREAEGGWRYVSGFKDGLKGSAQFSPDGGRLFVLSKDGAPMGKIVALDVAALAACPAELAGPPNLQLLGVLVPEVPDASIEDFVVTRSRIYATCCAGGPSRVLVYDAASGAALEAFPTPEAHVVFGLIPLPHSSAGGDDIYFASMGYTSPRALWRFSAAEGRAARTALVQESPVDVGSLEAVTEFCTSRDGTRVPVTIVRKAGLGPGPRPCVLYGYGGYGISMVPAFQASLSAWYSLGGLYVVANIRGGSEYGERWHLEGNLTKKQNVFDDFIAAAEHLVAGGHTSRELLALRGGSNGGLLVGAVVTQRPDLCRAAVAHVGIFDSLRTELEPNGVFNIPEFGTVKDEAQYRALRAYSPYHNLPSPSSGALPSLLLTTGENDGRVASWQSKKFAAALQPLYESMSADRHLVLRISYDTGHGQGTPLQKTVEEMADEWSFIAAELGVAPPAPEGESAP